MMKRWTYMLLAGTLAPTALSAQQDPLERLTEVLPEDVAIHVVAVVEDARARSLPEDAVANLALEGVAKGRSSEEVLAAVQSLAADMGRAQGAIQAAGRTPGTGEVEAATAALRMGVDGAAISELASSQPAGRSLAVPLLVLGSLAERGLPSDQALAEVEARLAARADDAALLGEVGQGIGRGQGGGPAETGPLHAAGMAGFQIPVAGVNVPVGPPFDVPRGPREPRGPGSTPGPPGGA